MRRGEYRQGFSRGVVSKTIQKTRSSRGKMKLFTATSGPILWTTSGEVQTGPTHVIAKQIQKTATPGDIGKIHKTTGASQRRASALSTSLGKTRPTSATTPGRGPRHPRLGPQVTGTITKGGEFNVTPDINLYAPPSPYRFARTSKRGGKILSAKSLHKGKVKARGGRVLLFGSDRKAPSLSDNPQQNWTRWGQRTKVSGNRPKVSPATQAILARYF